MPVNYRNTTQPVGCPRIMIENPRGSTSTIHFDRYRTAGTAPDILDIGISNAKLVYQADPSKPGYNGDTEVPLWENTIEGVTSLTYNQLYMIIGALFDQQSALQDQADVAREQYYNISALQGQPTPFL